MNHKLIIINRLLISSSIFQSFGQGVGKARKMTFLREMSFLRTAKAQKMTYFRNMSFFPKPENPKKPKVSPHILKQQKHKTMNYTIIIINILLISSSIFQSFGQGVGKARKLTFLEEMSFLRTAKAQKMTYFKNMSFFQKPNRK